MNHDNNTGTPDHKALFSDALGFAERRIHGSQPAALKLLQFESDIRKLTTDNELKHHLLHSPHSLCAYDVAFLFQWNENKKTFKATSATHVNTIDQDAPAIDAITTCINERFSKKTEIEQHLFDLSAPELAALNEGKACYGLAVPMHNKLQEAVAIVLFVRETTFSEGECILLKRLAETYTHAWLALNHTNTLSIKSGISKQLTVMIAAILAALCFIPVKQSVLVPVEVVPDTPFVLTSPINGVVNKLHIAPNQRITPGQLILEFIDIQFRNDMATAKQKIDVAKAREIGTVAASFQDAKAAHEIAIAKAEHELAVVEYEYAKELFERTKVFSESQGIAIFSDKREIEGKPFSIGQEILQIAQGDKTLFRLEIPIDSMIEISLGDKASIYLQSSPLGGNESRLVNINYKPKTLPSGKLGYIIYAKPNDASSPQLGARGVAKISGRDTYLVLSLLSQPIRIIRQTVGI